MISFVPLALFVVSSLPMSEIKTELTGRAKQLFGEERAEELLADIDKTAAEVTAVREFPLTIDNEL